MVLENLAPLLVVFILGALLKRGKILRKEHGSLISPLLLNIFKPATVLYALTASRLSFHLFLLPLSAFVIVSLLLVLAFAFVPILGLREKTRAAFVIAMPSLELGSIGYAFMITVYGREGAALLALFELGHALFFYTVIAFLAHLFGQVEEEFRLSQACVKLVKNPILWAYGVGIAYNMLQIQCDLLNQVFLVLSQPFLCLIAFFVAIELEPSLAAISFPAIVVYLKAATGLTIGVLVTLLFRLSGAEQLTVVLGSSLPASFMAVVYAREHQLDARFLVSMLSLALPAAVGVCLFLIAFVPH